MKTDDICERYENKNVGITLRMLMDEETKEPLTVLVEGGSAALRMLGELLVAVADEKENNSFSISPFGPGNIHFSKNAELGIYIHRTDD